MNGPSFNNIGQAFQAAFQTVKQSLQDFGQAVVKLFAGRTVESQPAQAPRADRAATGQAQPNVKPLESRNADVLTAQQPRAKPGAAASAQPAATQATSSRAYAQLNERIITEQWNTAGERGAFEAAIRREVQPGPQQTELLATLQREYDVRAANRPEVLAQRQADAAAMGTRLAALGLQTHDVPGNGHCMFHAIAHQLGTPGDPNAAQSAVRQQLLTYLNRITDDNQSNNHSNINARGYVAALPPVDKDNEDMASAMMFSVRDILQNGIGKPSVGQSGWGDDSHARLLALSTNRPVLLMNPGGDRLFDPAQPQRDETVPVTDAERQALMNGQPKPIVLIQNGDDHWQSTAPITQRPIAPQAAASVAAASLSVAARAPGLADVLRGRETEFVDAVAAIRKGKAGLSGSDTEMVLAMDAIDSNPAFNEKQKEALTNLLFGA